MNDPLKKSSWTGWAVVAMVLLATHAVAAKLGADRLNLDAAPGVTLDSSLDEWIAVNKGADSGAYLAVAKNFADGKGLVDMGTGPDPNALGPFYYWGPGTPYVLGQWLSLTSGTTAWSLFWFAVIALLVWGGTVVAIAALYTRSTMALAATAFLTGCCPPLHGYFYSRALANSEIVALVPLALTFFALNKAFLARTADACAWPVLRWFSIAGLCLGAASLVRDSLAQLAAFIAALVVLQALVSLLLRRPRRVGLALASAAALVACTRVARVPVQQWNLTRIGIATVCTSSDGAVWRHGLWDKHDLHPWGVTCGVGFGEYLDPEAARRVEAYYAAGKPNPALYSLGQLLQAVWQRPLDAIWFKVSRMPVLWLATDQWQLNRGYVASAWCAAFYAMLLAYLVARWRSGQTIPPPLYVYPLFLAGVMPLVHFEFRYSIPAWQMLVVLPALWAEHFAEARRRTGVEIPAAVSRRLLATQSAAA